MVSDSDTKLPEVQSQPSNTACGKLCDPTPAAYKLAEEKARLRALDSRHPTNLIRAREFEKHLAAVENARPVVDTSSPLVPKAYYHKIYQSNLSGLFHAKIEFANARLLASLASIYSGHSKSELDNRLLSTTRSIRNRPLERAVKTMELMHENLKKFESLKRTKAFYSTKDLGKWHSQQKKILNRISKFPPISKPKACPLVQRRVMERSLIYPRQYAYLLIEVEDKLVSNLVIELYADLCPFTVRNFQKLCTNTKATACDCRTYRCKKIDRLHCVQMIDGQFKKIYWLFGEHVDSTVEYTQFMLKECSSISHSEAGLVTRPKGRAGGVFFITIEPCRHLDEFCYVFGRVIGTGMEFLRKMEHKNIQANGQPIINMHITDCGVVASPGEVPPPMLLHDFISQVRHDVLPFMKKDANRPGEWVGKKSAFAELLRERAEEKLLKIDRLKKEQTELDQEQEEDDEDVDDETNEPTA